MSMVFVRCAVLCLLLMPAQLSAFPFYRYAIPNGFNVPDPCHPGNIWTGVGHLIIAGGGPRNPFGEDFEAAGKVWTKELCGKDSDGDGLSNGQELGDPNCEWSMTNQTELSVEITHPGINDNTPGCSSD